MLTITKTFENRGLIELDLNNIEPGCWFNLIKPTAEELLIVEKATQAPHDFIQAALDPEESSRLDVEDNHILTLINVPVNKDALSRAYDTIPLAIINTPDYVVTVCQEENQVLNNFRASRYKYFTTFQRTRFLFQILYISAMLFLKDLRQITENSDRIEQNLRKSMKNKELFQLLDLQKGLTYYSVSLRSNRVVAERVLRLCSNAHNEQIIKLREEDEDLLDDVLVEYRQAIEIAQLQTDVLAGMMDAFASVIANNLNIVMKFLASVTIVMAIPSLISGLFGMNVPVPWGTHPMGFYFIGLFTVVVTTIAIIFLWKKKLF